MSEIANARRALVTAVDEAPGEAGFTFLQVVISGQIDVGFSIRHRDDAGVPDRCLETSTDPHRARLIAQTTELGQHRPLKTSPNLRRGWLLHDLDERALWTALDYLYPACALDWHREREGRLAVTPWQETAARQSGIYAAVRLLESDDLPRTVKACCARGVCGRRVAWGETGDAEPLTELGDGLGGSATIPCPEPCSLFISFARKVTILERAPRRAIPGVGILADAEVEQMRAAVAMGAAGTLDSVGEGEFGDPTNRRRLRYLAARLRDTPAEAAEAAGPTGEVTTVEPCDGCPRPEPCEGCPLV